MEATADHKICNLSSKECTKKKKLTSSISKSDFCFIVRVLRGAPQSEMARKSVRFFLVCLEERCDVLLLPGDLAKEAGTDLLVWRLSVEEGGICRTKVLSTFGRLVAGRPRRLGAAGFFRFRAGCEII